MQGQLIPKDEQNNSRPLADFPHTEWSFSFSTFTFSESEFESHNKRVEELKQAVNDMLMASTRDPVENIEFIDLLSRLGVSYHFQNEIEDQVNHVFDGLVPILMETNGFELHTVALLFRVLRQHGHKVSSDVFLKFKDTNGEFKKTIANDVKGILSFYEATFLRVPGENILDDALEFTRKNLEYLATESSPRVAKYIKNVLIRPFHKDIPRIEARQYISFYEEDDFRNETLLMFAKLDFNRVQLVHQHELSILSSWWKDLNFPVELPYARDRIAEAYFWTNAIQFEPQYSKARIVCAKVANLISILDDTFDAYATFEELQRFINAIDRWSMDASDQLPADYMKLFYKTIINLFNEIENDVSKEGRHYSVHYTKEAFKELAKAYFVEAGWRESRYVPPLDEYCHTGKITSSYVAVTASFFVGVKDAGIEEYEWLTSKPKVVEAGNLILRLMNDIVSHEFEQQREHCASSVECYMKEFRVSEKEAVKELTKIYENAWKDMNEDCMKPTAISMHHLNMYVNLIRLTDVIYEYDDSYTIPLSLKDRIKLLFVEKIPL